MILPAKEEFWNVFRNTNGALSTAESIGVMQCAALAPKGRYIECGVYHGKSAMSALMSLKEFESDDKDAIEFILVDPIFNDRIVCEQVLNTFNAVTDKLIAYSFWGTTSIEEIPKHNDYAYVMLDSADHDEIVMQEVKLIEDRVMQDGVILFHDWNSQFVRVMDAYNYLLRTGKYEEIKINWDEINAYVKEHDLEKSNLSWHHQELESPNFLGALKRK